MTSSLQDRRRRFMASEIEQAALQLFAERGFDAVTVDQIAAEVGISGRTFFRYFATKDEVVLQYQRHLQERLARAVTARPADEGPVTALRNAYIDTSTTPAEGREALVLRGRFLQESRSLSDRSAGERAAQQQVIVGLLADRMGVAHDDTRAETIAVSIGAAASAAFQRWVTDGGVDEDPAKRIGAAIDLLEDGLRALDRPATRRRRSA